jgi:hypothetical protein
VQAVEGDVLAEELDRVLLEELCDTGRATVALNRFCHLVTDEVEAILVLGRAGEPPLAGLLPCDRTLPESLHHLVEDGEVFRDPRPIRTASVALARGPQAARAGRQTSRIGDQVRGTLETFPRARGNRGVKRVTFSAIARTPWT